MTVSSMTDAATSSSRKRRLRAAAVKKRLWLEQQSSIQADRISNQLDHLLQLSTSISSTLHFSSVHVPIYVPYYACSSHEAKLEVVDVETNLDKGTHDSGLCTSTAFDDACNVHSADAGLLGTPSSNISFEEHVPNNVDSGQSSCAHDVLITAETADASSSTTEQPTTDSSTSLPPEAFATLQRALSQLSGVRLSVAIGRLKQLSGSTSDNLAELAAGINETEFLVYLQMVSSLLDKEYSLPGNSVNPANSPRILRGKLHSQTPQKNSHGRHLVAIQRWYMLVARRGLQDQKAASHIDMLLCSR